MLDGVFGGDDNWSGRHQIARRYPSGLLPVLAAQDAGDHRRQVVRLVVPGRQGWSVLIQGPAHHVESEAERESAAQAGVEPWAPGERELFLRIVPHRVTGRRIKPA
jgi:hypothetical protein